MVQMTTYVFFIVCVQKNNDQSVACVVSLKQRIFLTKRKMQLSFSVIERLTNVHLLLQCTEVGITINIMCLPRQCYRIIKMCFLARDEQYTVTENPENINVNIAFREIWFVYGCFTSFSVGLVSTV